MYNTHCSLPTLTCQQAISQHDSSFDTSSRTLNQHVRGSSVRICTLKFYNLLVFIGGCNGVLCILRQKLTIIQLMRYWMIPSH